MFPIILCEFDTDSEETYSYYDYVKIKLDNLSLNKSLKYLKKEIKKHKKQIKDLKKKNKKAFKINGHSAYTSKIRKKYNELNFLNQKYSQFLKKGV